MLTLIEKALIYIRNEEGQALAQTGLAVGLVAIMCLVAVSAVGLVVSGNLYDFAIAIDGGSSLLRVN